MFDVSFLQSTCFAGFQNAVPYRSAQYIGGDKNGGGFVVSIQHRLGFRSLWLPYGPLVYSSAFFEKLKRLAQNKKAVFARIEPPLHWQRDYTEELAEWYDLRSAPKRSTPECTLIINLKKTDQQLLAEMKPKGRYNIKVAQKYDVSVQCFNSFEEIPAHNFAQFYTLLRQTAVRDGFGIHPQFFYEQLLKTCAPHKMVALFLAYDKGGVVLCGLIAVYFGKTATYYYGASDYSKRQLMAPYLLHWEAIKDARSRSMEYYDFFGIAPPNEANHPWRSVGEFKKKFGGSEIKYPPAFDIVYRPLLYRLLRK